MQVCTLLGCQQLPQLLCVSVPLQDGDEPCCRPVSAVDTPPELRRLPPGSPQGVLGETGRGRWEAEGLG